MQEDAARKRTDRRLVIGLVVLGVILVLLIAGLLVRWLAPALLEQIGLIHPTATAGAEASASAISPVASGMAVETAPPPVTPALAVTPAGAAILDDQLAQAAALTLRSRFEEATIIYAALAQQYPEDARPQIGWAWALIYDLDAGQALPLAEGAVELDRSSAEAATVLARACTDTGDVTRALAQARKAIQLAPGSAQAHAILADAFRLDGQDEEALKEAELAATLDPSNADAKRARAWLYLTADENPVQAAAELQGAAGLQPQLWLRRHELGLLLLEVGEPATALLAFQDALSLRAKPVTYAGLGHAYYQLAQYDEARVALQQAVDLGLQDPQALAVLAAALAQTGRCDEARTYAAGALALDPTQPLALEAGDLCQEVAEPARVATPSAVADLTAEPPQRTRTPGPPSLGGRIAFPVWNAASGKYDTYLAQAKDGSARTLVMDQVRQPAIRPDGEWLAVNGERSGYDLLCLVKPDGGSLMEITPYTEDGQPDWSPDGTRLVLASYRHGGDHESRLYVLDGIPYGGGKVEGRSLNHGTDDIRGQMPAWTGDGRVVYRGCGLDSAPYACNGLGLYVVSAASGVQTATRLTDVPGDSNPAVSGSQIAFMSNRDGDWEIYLMRVDGTGVRQLTQNSASDGLPAWSPDGSTLAFVSDELGVWAVWAMSPDGSNRRRLFDVGGNGLGPDWTQEQISWGP